MLCGRCNKNQAAKTYELIKNGKKMIEYYCLDCYHRQFVNAEKTAVVSACPYCGTTEAQIQKTKLVGCANCYQTLAHVVLPMLTKMQGGEDLHYGKAAYETPMERVDKRIKELDVMAKKYYLENDDKAAAVYEEKIDCLYGEKGDKVIWHNPLLSNPS